MSRRTLLLDGDQVVYQIAAGCETCIEWSHDVCSTHADLREARGKLDDYLESLLIDLDASEIVICLSADDHQYFRKRVYPDYKANRKGKAKPFALKALKNRVKQNFRYYQRDGLEADDCLGILLTASKIIRGEKVCVSADKDLKTVPGLHSDLAERVVFEVDLKTADYNHLYQTLIGDTTDGYPGCPGVGAKTAEKLLQDTDKTIKTMWPVVVEQFTKKGLTEKDALVQARVARILRASDYNFKTKEPILWEPKW